MMHLKQIPNSKSISGKYIIPKARRFLVDYLFVDILNYFKIKIIKTLTS